MRVIKKIFLWALAILLLLVIQGVILVFIYEKEIKSAALTRLNEHVNTPIKVGKIELSYFQHFPFIALTFPDVVIYDSYKEHQHVLLSAQEISLFFNIWDVYKGDYHVKKLYVKNGTWSSRINKDGVSNFDIIKPSGTTSANTNFKLNIDEIILVNTSILHIDEQLKHVYRTDVDKLKAMGNFNSDEFNLKLIANLNVHAVNIEHISYIKNKIVTLNTSFFVDLKNSRYQFKETSITIGKMLLLLDGEITYSNKIKNINLLASGKDLDIQSFISLLPQKYVSTFKDYKSEGNMYFNLKLIGSLAKNKTPLIIADVGFQNTKVIVNNDKVKNQEINKLNFNLTYTNNATENISDDVLNVKTLEAYYNNRPIKGSVIITEFNNPYLDLTIATNQSLVEIQKIWPIKNVNFSAGEIDINLKLRAKIEDLKKDNTIKHVESEGRINITNTNLRVGQYGLPIEHLNGSYHFQKSDLRINNMSFQIGSSDFNIQGFFRNLFSFLLTENEDLEMDATLISKKINLKELLGSSANGTEEEPYRLKINPRLTSNITLKIKELEFLPFQAFNVEGALLIKDQIINTDYLVFNSQKGLVFAKLNFNTTQKNKMPMNIDLTLNKVDASNLFREFNNFGVDILTDKHIRGRISSSMKINMIWDETLNTLLDEFQAKGNILIENGELLNFEPMLALGKYIDVNELKNLRFSNLENTIEIKNRTIVIPSMEIKSNALNLRLSGTHTFDNTIDYHLQMLLSDLIKKKSKRLGDERFGEIEPDGSGNTKLYIRMYGSATDPKFSLDKKEIRKKIAEDFKQERVEIKSILKDEFGSWFKKEKEFKESIREESAEWEKDIPKPTNKPVISKSDSTNKKSKSGLQKLKEKLQEKPEEEEYE